jgi:hypothetical protein
MSSTKAPANKRHARRVSALSLAAAWQDALRPFACRLTRLAGYKQSRKNPSLCSHLPRGHDDGPGGAEVDIAVKVKGCLVGGGLRGIVRGVRIGDEIKHSVWD